MKPHHFDVTFHLGDLESKVVRFSSHVKNQCFVFPYVLQLDKKTKLCCHHCIPFIHSKSVTKPDYYLSYVE